MKNFNLVIAISILLLTNLISVGQTSLNTAQIGHLSYNQSLSEVRGALHNNREYALVGVNNGFSIVDVTNAASPTEIFFEAGPNSIWRDPFYHNGYAYCVTEGGGGMLIVDMSPLPGSTSLTTTLYTGSQFNISSAHNMFIESATERAYLFGTNDVDGVIILDISNPMSPVEIGIWNDYYIHDGFVRGDTLWAGCLADGAFVVDVSNAGSPVILANWDTPSEFAHNIWPSDDNAYSYTTDEVNSGFVAAYDMSNLQNVVESDKVRHPLSEGVIPHNTHFLNDYIITSHYRDGLTIHDVSDPSNIILTGYFDSSPLSGSGFNGSWGAWPYLPSGNLLIADIEEGLFVISATYKRGARLEGTVTEFGTSNPLNDVLITVVGAGLVDNSNLFGDYATGTEAAGTYSVTFEKGGYISQTIAGVELVNGQIEILDVELVPDVAFNLSGMVTEEGTGNPISGATVQFVNPFFNIEATSNGAGNYSENEFYAGQYEVTVAAWGYVGECSLMDITSGGTPPNFELQVGYHDDFTLDLGWTVTGNASAGEWERDVPIETTFDNSISNPGTDSNGDCGDQAFITGNAGGGAGSDDVDDGVTILRSPVMDLTSYNNPTVQFDYWFFNGGGSSGVNDEFIVKVDNGTNVVTLASLPQTSNVWTPYSNTLASQISISTTMQLVVEVADTDPGHLVEGGLDKFRIAEATSIDEETANSEVFIYPNPAKGMVSINVTSETTKGIVKFYDVTGKLIYENNSLVRGVNQVVIPTLPGVYVCEVFVNNERHIQRLLVH